MLSDIRFRRYFQAASVIALFGVANLACARFGESGSDASPVEAGGSNGTTSPPSDGGVDSATLGATVTVTPTPPASCPGAADCERVVFVTGLRYYAQQIGGIAGADFECNTMAALAGSARVSGRTFVAWLSDGTTSPAQRMIHGTRAYVRPDGLVVADDFASLTSGAALQNPIALDEDGDEHTGSAWTGTSALGVAEGGNCEAWTGGSASANYGVVSRTTAGWTTTAGAASGDPPLDCQTDQARMYCIEK